MIFAASEVRDGRVLQHESSPAKYYDRRHSASLIKLLGVPASRGIEPPASWQYCTSQLQSAWYAHSYVGTCTRNLNVDLQAI